MNKQDWKIAKWTWWGTSMHTFTTVLCMTVGTVVLIFGLMEPSWVAKLCAIWIGGGILVLYPVFQYKSLKKSYYSKNDSRNGL